MAWNSATAIYLDYLYHSVSEDGLFERLYALGDVTRLASTDEIETAVRRPPTDTRAWLRGMVIDRLPDSYGKWDYFNVFEKGTRVGLLDLSDPVCGGETEAEAVWAASKTAEEFVQAWNRRIR